MDVRNAVSRFAIAALGLAFLPGSAAELSLSLVNAAFAEGPSLRSIYYCDSEQHARQFAELTLKNDPGKALRMINEESYRATGTLAACGSTNVLFVEVEA